MCLRDSRRASTEVFVRPNVGAPLERLVRPHPLVYGRTRRYSASCHAAWTPRSALPAVAWQDFKPPCLSRCRKGQCLPRRPNELAKHHSCLRSAVLRFSKVAPSNCLRASWHCLPAVTCLLFTLSLFLTSTRLGPTVLCVVAGRTGLSRLLSSPREALTLLAHRTACIVRPNVRAKRATTAGRAGQQAQNGAKPQRLMAGAACRWRSA